VKSFGLYSWLKVDLRISYSGVQWHSLSHSSILVRQNKPCNCGNIEWSMDLTPPLGPMARTGIGRLRLAVRSTTKEFLEPLAVKQPTSKVAPSILWPAKLLLLFITKDRLAILPSIPPQRFRMPNRLLM
jgi:hypothetical protein